MTAARSWNAPTAPSVAFVLLIPSLRPRSTLARPSTDITVSSRPSTLLHHYQRTGRNRQGSEPGDPASVRRGGHYGAGGDALPDAVGRRPSDRGVTPHGSSIVVDVGRRRRPRRELVVDRVVARARRVAARLHHGPLRRQRR